MEYKDIDFDNILENDYYIIKNNSFCDSFFYEKGDKNYYRYDDENMALFGDLVNPYSDFLEKWCALINHLTAPAKLSYPINQQDVKNLKEFLSKENNTLENIMESEQLLKFIESVIKWNTDRNEIDADLIKRMKFPIIIRTYLDFFKKWEEGVQDDEKKEAIHNHSNKMAMDKNLERLFSFFNNSSIWVRLVDINDETALETAEKEFDYFEKIGLYKYDSAWENLEYNLRILSENYLKSTSTGHGNYVTPILYGNETKAYGILVGNKTSRSTNSEPQEGNPPSEKSFLKKLWERIKTGRPNVFNPK